MGMNDRARQNADDRGIEGATMTGAQMKAIRHNAGLSIYELASILRYRDIDGLRKMESRDTVTGPVQLVMEMIADGRLNPDAEFGTALTGLTDFFYKRIMPFDPVEFC